ncbi:hypothetical protein J2Z49_002109 [Desulfofundulus luciae]|uniref:DUF91 domain-containing protein n=1 Tax=Desulfofundulus luciae TaxID=74702 RepID=A0ABU0B2P5_9FIRM|nr:endonuclease NucS domain-containing protein [Desulfofundulus luciae]MDQ0286992.1 hypothetical protein [Desulfofundulus luciae]
MATCLEAVKDAVTKLGGTVTTRQVIDYIYEKYPDRPWKESTIQCHLIGLSANHPSSKHYPYLRKQPCLFYVGRGQYRLYNPETDGEWAVTEKGVVQVDEEIDEIEEEIDEAVISLEKDLEEYIVRNLEQIEEGLQLYSEDSISGRQYRTDVGRIDILAVDKEGGYLVIELKAGKASHSAAGQVLSYISWVRRNIAGSKNVRGIIIAEDFDRKLKYAVSEIPNISLKKYEVNFVFKDIS